MQATSLCAADQTFFRPFVKLDKSENGFLSLFNSQFVKQKNCSVESFIWSDHVLHGLPRLEVGRERNSQKIQQVSRVRIEKPITIFILVFSFIFSSNAKRTGDSETKFVVNKHVCLWRVCHLFSANTISRSRGWNFVNLQYQLDGFGRIKLFLTRAFSFDEIIFVLARTLTWIKGSK